MGDLLTLVTKKEDLSDLTGNLKVLHINQLFKRIAEEQANTMPSCKGSAADSDSDWEAPTQVPDAEPISAIPSESGSLVGVQDAATAELTNEAGVETCSEIGIAPSLEAVKNRSSAVAPGNSSGFARF